MKLLILAAVSALSLATGSAHAGPGRPLRAAVKAQFDANHDGRLQPRERKQAARALKRLAKRMERAQGRNARKARLIRRFDLNGDGNLGPGEVPPAIANELRPLDRDGDGWLQGNELP